MMVAISLPYLFQEHLKTSAIGLREVHTEALSAARLYRRIQVGPFVYPTYYARWTKPHRAVAPSVPVDQSEACLIKCQNLQRLFGMLLVLLLDPSTELFLKSSCCCWSAFSCRGRPVLGFALRRLRSPPTLSG